MQTNEWKGLRKFWMTMIVSSSALQANPSYSANSAEPTVLLEKQYVSTGNQLQQFSENIALQEQDRGKPLIFTFYNGPNTLPRFNWVRVFLSDQSNASQARAAAPGQPTGQLIVSEASFKAGVSKVDLSLNGLIRPGNTSTLIINGAGLKGATIGWKITTPASGTLQIISITPTTARAGGSLMVSGNGFSEAASDNSVYLDQTKLPVAQSSATNLQLTLPSQLVPGKYRLQVVSKGSKSNSLPLKVLGMPELTRTDWLAGPSNSTVTIYGKNFSEDPAENHVFFGKVQAQVLSATSEVLTVTVPFFPELDGGTYYLTPTPLDLTLTVGKTKAMNHLTFYSARVGWQ